MAQEIVVATVTFAFLLTLYPHYSECLPHARGFYVRGAQAGDAPGHEGMASRPGDGIVIDPIPAHAPGSQGQEPQSAGRAHVGEVKGPDGGRPSGPSQAPPSITGIIEHVKPPYKPLAHRGEPISTVETIDDIKDLLSEEHAGSHESNSNRREKRQPEKRSPASSRGQSNERGQRNVRGQPNKDGSSSDDIDDPRIRGPPHGRRPSHSRGPSASRNQSSEREDSDGRRPPFGRGPPVASHPPGASRPPHSIRHPGGRGPPDGRGPSGERGPPGGRRPRPVGCNERPGGSSESGSESGSDSNSNSNSDSEEDDDVIAEVITVTDTTKPNGGLSAEEDLDGTEEELAYDATLGDDYHDAIAEPPTGDAAYGGDADEHNIDDVIVGDAEASAEATVSDVATDIGVSGKPDADVASSSVDSSSASGVVDELDVGASSSSDVDELDENEEESSDASDANDSTVVTITDAALDTNTPGDSEQHTSSHTGNASDLEADPEKPVVLPGVDVDSGSQTHTVANGAQAQGSDDEESVHMPLIPIETLQPSGPNLPMLQ